MEQQNSEYVLDLRTAKRKVVHVNLTVNPEMATRLSQELDLLDLRKATLQGTLTPKGKSDWVLQADIGATATQPCSLTLAPVTSRIDTKVRRYYAQDLVWEELETETEMPEDDDREPLPAHLDLVSVLSEIMSLELPTFPKAKDAEFGQLGVTEKGVAVMTDEDAKPFAGLAGLKDKLTQSGK